MAASTAALRGITKQYKNFTLGPVDMTVPAGSIVGLIGENGAGKTTLLKILCGVNRADDGTVDLLSLIHICGSPAAMRTEHSGGKPRCRISFAIAASVSKMCIRDSIYCCLACWCGSVGRAADS